MAESIRGKVHFIDDTKTFGQKGFRKRLVVIEQDNARFTNYIPIDFIQDGCDAVDELTVGDEVEVTYRLSGRKWQKDARSETKYFVSVEALRFNKLGESSGPPADVNDQLNSIADDDAPVDSDDIPF